VSPTGASCAAEAEEAASTRTSSPAASPCAQRIGSEREAEIQIAREHLRCLDKDSDLAQQSLAHAQISLTQAQDAVGELEAKIQELKNRKIEADLTLQRARAEYEHACKHVAQVEVQWSRGVEKVLRLSGNGSNSKDGKGLADGVTIPTVIVDT
jgi:chromosome segregation ATPase